MVKYNKALHEYECDSKVTFKTHLRQIGPSNSKQSSVIGGSLGWCVWGRGGNSVLVCQSASPWKQRKKKAEEPKVE